MLTRFSAEFFGLAPTNVISATSPWKQKFILWVLIEVFLLCIALGHYLLNILGFGVPVYILFYLTKWLSSVNIRYNALTTMDTGILDQQIAPELLPLNFPLVDSGIDEDAEL